ncbi:MAG: SocA family protein [Candidatus Magnetoovum sp. WYHC-5]|nr:SocA family protein [Candidatus Magnetoovum sp. WYHC-5]
MKALTIIEAIYYILRKIKEADKIKIIKLLYLADKYHAIHYGRTITDDDYYVMEYGPVGLKTTDILSLSTLNLLDKELDYALQLFGPVGKYTFKVNELQENNFEFDMLSETDIEALDFVIDKFGCRSTLDITEYTHQYPEWQQQKNSLSNGNGRKKIDTLDLFSLIKDDLLGMPKEHVQESINIFTGLGD